VGVTLATALARVEAQRLAPIDRAAGQALADRIYPWWPRVRAGNVAKQRVRDARRKGSARLAFPFGEEVGA
jgi:hypothetical protein